MSCCGQCDKRMYNPGPTVKASPVPLYQLGWMLGQDDSSDDSSDDSGIDQTALEQAEGGYGLSETQVYGPPAAGQTSVPSAGPMTPSSSNWAAPASSAAGSIASALTSAVTRIFNPSPSVSATPRPTVAPTGSAAAWVQQNPDALIIGGIVLALLIGGRR